MVRAKSGRDHPFRRALSELIRLPNTQQFHDLLTVSLGGVGVIEHVINGTGGATPSTTTPVNMTSYP